MEYFNTRLSLYVEPVKQGICMIVEFNIVGAMRGTGVVLKEQHSHRHRETVGKEIPEPQLPILCPCLMRMIFFIPKVQTVDSNDTARGGC
jgi:hypothetical protein